MVLFKKFFPYLLCITILLLFTIDERYVIDRIGIQVFVLSILNTVGLFYFTLLKPKPIRVFKSKEVISTLIILFLIFNVVSIIFAYNKIEALISFNRYFQFFISFFVIKFCISEIKNPEKFTLYLILSISLLENLYSFYSIINYYIDNGVINRTYLIKGFSGNINITAFSILYKIPIILYAISLNKKFAVIGLFLVYFSIFNILSYGTRGAYICLPIIFLSHFSFLLYKKKFFTKKSLLSLITILLCFVTTSTFLKNTGVNVAARAETISFNTVDGSVNQRLRYYNQIISQFISNPLEILGVGNYKLRSIEYDKEDIVKYIIPYNAHNDFLEILIEIGLLGFLVYGAIFLKALDICFNQMKLFGRELFFYMILFIIVYGIDSMLNFPYSRLISCVYFMFILAYLTLTEKKSAY